MQNPCPSIPNKLARARPSYCRVQLKAFHLRKSSDRGPWIIYVLNADKVSFLGPRAWTLLCGNPGPFYALCWRGWKIKFIYSFPGRRFRIRRANRKTEARGREFERGVTFRAKWKWFGIYGKILVRPESTAKNKKYQMGGALIVVKVSCSIIFTTIYFRFFFSVAGRPNEIFLLWQVQPGKLQVKAFPVLAPHPARMLFRKI